MKKEPKDLKVLIVDDSITERYTLEKIMKDEGFLVITARSGDEGIEKAKEEKPDLILMDVVMPGVNGYQATREIAKNPDLNMIPIIMCTSKKTDVDKMWGLKQGAQEYIVKPISRPLLIEKVNKIMGLQ